MKYQYLKNIYIIIEKRGMVSNIIDFKLGRRKQFWLKNQRVEIQTNRFMKTEESSFSPVASPGFSRAHNNFRKIWNYKHSVLFLRRPMTTALMNPLIPPFSFGSRGTLNLECEIKTARSMICKFVERKWKKKSNK